VSDYSGVGAGFRIVVLILLVGVLALGGLVWFDYLGVIDARSTLAPVFRLFGARPPELDAEDPLLLDKERLAKQLEALAVRAEEQAALEQKLAAQERDLTQKIEQVQEREQAVEDREKLFNERVKAYDNRRDNVKQNSAYLVGMPPDKAVKILLAMEDQDVIDLMRVTEELAVAAGEDSLVAYWLSLMPADRAAALQRKMARKTGG
jgi:flagellar protein FlbB